MWRFKPVKVLLGTVGLAIGVAGVLALREATLSTHEDPEELGEKMELVVHASSKGGEGGQSLDEMVEAQLLACRLEVTSDYTGPIEPLGDGRYRAVLTPSLDLTNRKQFRGCVEDWVIDHVRINVVDLTELD
ncbi:MAG TPA: hypothetical protein VK611_26005 [Acidimicrobiales bacterium]|nr:hypothetical protein [Acidimicrobiales bacterium]